MRHGAAQETVRWPRSVVVLHAVARALGVAAMLLVCGGIPASILLRPVVLERSAPPLPAQEDGIARDAALLVRVRAPDGGPIAGARIRVLAIRTEGDGVRAYAAGDARTAPEG